MKLTVDFNISDMNEAPLAVGDTVEYEGARKTIESFDLVAEIDYFTGEAEGYSLRGYARYVNFKGGGFANPTDCVKVEPTTAERIEAVLNDTDLTDGEALDEILRIIGHERRW